MAGEDIQQHNENQGNINDKSNQGNWNKKMELTKLGEIYQAYDQSCCEDNCQ
jgi:hypothetical protein